VNLVLCICTYRRPDSLSKLLNTLPELKLPEPLLKGRFSVVVVDNHAEAEGLAACEALQQNNYPLPLIALAESGDGISAARNTAVTTALSLKPDWLAFLDDDEWPESQWLEQLLHIQSEHNADLVGGPTCPVFPDHAPAQLLDNQYYGADLQLPDGAACQLQAGGNFLIKASVFNAFTPPVFHPSFAQSGGEDLAFFTQAAAKGFSMHWAANAIVHEPVPASRLQPEWLKHRIITIHNSRVRVMQLLQPGIMPALMRVLKTIGLGVLAAGLTLLSVPLPSVRETARMLRWKFQGKLMAHVGSTKLRGETYS